MNKIIRSLLAVLILALGLINTSQATETITYFHEDAGGSPIAATDEAGNLLWRESYQPYGDRLKKQDGNTNKIWFHGKQQDADTGLSYFGARYYDPVVGRFMGVDPQGYEESNPHSFNRYAYGNNNPYKFVDPDGRAAALVIFLPEVSAAAWAAMVKATAFVTGAAAAWYGNKILNEEHGEKGGDAAGSGADAGAKKPTVGEGTKGEGSKGVDKAKPDGGKDSAKGKEKDVPNRGEPGEVREGQRRTREYGADGKPVRDYDKPHQGYERPHVHEWENGVREHPGRDYSPIPRQGG